LPIIHGASAPVFTAPGAEFTGLASPSRGATQTCVWRVSIRPGAGPAEHSFDREEVLVATGGRAVATLDGTSHDVTAGDAIVVPAQTAFSIKNPYQEPFAAVVALPVGARARLATGETLIPSPAR
jgi:mannose-6-phosphate isomerase-like protein (cupin superfamily)